MMKGWECPRCGKINSPFAEKCDCFPVSDINSQSPEFSRPVRTGDPLPLEYPISTCESDPLTLF